MTKKDLLLLMYIMKIKKPYLTSKEKAGRKKIFFAQFGNEYKYRIERGKSLPMRLEGLCTP